MNNRKQSSKEVASLASKTLKDARSSDIAKELAASVLAQSRTSKQTGEKMEDIASKVLRSDKYSEETKILAGSVLSQSNKGR